MGKLDHIKTKNFCVTKDTTQKSKRQPIEDRKIFEKYIHLQKYNKLLQLRNKNKNNPT
jgi:hypothetical protein